jgi:hypothetical protein
MWAFIEAEAASLIKNETKLSLHSQTLASLASIQAACGCGVFAGCCHASEKHIIHQDTGGQPKYRVKQQAPSKASSGSFAS